jgi:ribonuclease HII
MARRALGSRDRELLKHASEIVGIDEAGRGCLAGPVVVCGVGFRRIPRNPLIQDSKQLSVRQRDEAAAFLEAHCERWLITEIWVELIDRINILEATRLAVRAIATSLGSATTSIVVDHVDPGDVIGEVQAVPKADSEFFCVAAASILAKVHRDRLMARLAARHARWQWDRNKGYGTVQHRRALDRHGRSYLHRKSFAWSPVLR